MVSNYRPISLLPQFSKILEKLIAVRFISFIEKEKILINEQYGFQKHVSTSHALHSIVENITESLENKLNVIGICIDLQKAFDTVNHSLLLEKLLHYGIRGSVYDMFKSYLDNRKQFVSLHNCQSTYSPVTCGVPQGSVLGPLLFLIYVNDICQSSERLKFVLFADDTNIFYSSNNLSTFENIVNNELISLATWFSVNKLSLNVQKTSYMLFCKRTCRFDPIIRMNGIVLERVRCTKFLGVQLDDKLLWKNHIAHIRSKMSSVLSVLYKVHLLIDRESLILLYNTLFVPHMYYCCSIWGNTCKSYLKPITAIQKRAAYLLNPNLGSTNHVFSRYNLLKFIDIVHISTALVAFDAYNGILPDRLRVLYKPVSNNPNSKNCDRFISVTAKSNMRFHCITASSIRIWNSLSSSLKQCKHKKRFKITLKQQILLTYL